MTNLRQMAYIEIADVLEQFVHRLINAGLRDELYDLEEGFIIRETASGYEIALWNGRQAGLREVDSVKWQADIEQDDAVG